mmetsp:Transcript_1678/g.2722  ORF Transcript_1678/g.2722 Transcript_1678/m.2722 type:complete len:118 (-) Transcript_1678:235-588(-)
MIAPPNNPDAAAPAPPSNEVLSSDPADAESVAPGEDIKTPCEIRETDTASVGADGNSGNTDVPGLVKSTMTPFSSADGVGECGLRTLPDASITDVPVVLSTTATRRQKQRSSLDGII